jgi:uncharacterized membrane protein
MKNKNLNSAKQKLKAVVKNCESLKVHIKYVDQYGKTIPSKEIMQSYNVIIPDFFCWSREDRVYLNTISTLGNYAETKSKLKKINKFQNNLYSKIDGVDKYIYPIDIGETYFDTAWKEKDPNFEIFWSDTDSSFSNGGKYDSLDSSPEAIEYRGDINNKFREIRKFHLLNNLADVIEIYKKGSSEPISILMIFSENLLFLTDLLIDCDIKVTTETNSISQEYDLLYDKTRGLLKNIRFNAIRNFIEKSSDEDVQNRSELYKRYSRILSKKFLTKTANLNLPPQDFMHLLANKLEEFQNK